MVSLSLNAELCHYYLGRAEGDAHGWVAPFIILWVFFFPEGFVIY